MYGKNGNPRTPPGGPVEKNPPAIAGDGVQSFVEEEPTGRAATNAVSKNSLSLCFRDCALSKRTTPIRKPPVITTTESLCPATKIQHNQNNSNN